MAKPYPQELRDRVLAAYDRGMKTHQIADVFQVSPSWTRLIKQRRRETGETRPRPMGGATVIKIDMAQWRQLVEAQPDATIKEWHSRLDADCCESAVGLALKRLGLSFKKRRSMPPSKTVPMSRRVVTHGNAINPIGMRAV